MSDPYAPQDPNAAGREPEQPGSAPPPPPPPPYGAQPPAYGEQPPAYGAPPPPAYGEPQPPAYGAPAPPPAYGAPAPPAYGAPPDQPTYNYGAQPVGYAYPKNSLAVWSLVLGIVAFVLLCGFFSGIPAIILGYKAKRAAAEGQANNAGMGTAGIVLGWIATIGSVILLAGIILLVVNGNWTGDFNEFRNMNNY